MHSSVYTYSQELFSLLFDKITRCMYQLGYVRFDSFKNSKCETIFTSKTVCIMITETKWRTEVIALRPFFGLYLNICFKTRYFNIV